MDTPILDQFSARQSHDTLADKIQLTFEPNDLQFNFCNITHRFCTMQVETASTETSGQVSTPASVPTSYSAGTAPVKAEYVETINLNQRTYNSSFPSSSDLASTEPNHIIQVSII